MVRMNQAPATRRIVIVAFPGVQPLDVVGPAEVFGTAERLVHDSYEIEVVAETADPISPLPAGTRTRGRRPPRGVTMLTAYLLYPGFTALDITGPHDVLNSVPGSESIFVAEEAGPVRNESDTLSLVADKSIAEVTSPDILVVPGGFGTRVLLDHEPLLSWIRQVNETTTWTTSVCTGSLLLAAAGLLDEAPATTHWCSRGRLGEMGVNVRAERVVEHGKIITAAGVSSGIDMALTLVQRIHGDEVASAVQLGIEYNPEPPLDSGSPEKADPEITKLVAAVFADLEPA